MFHQGDVFSRLDKFNVYLLTKELDGGIPVYYIYELYGYRDSDPKVREPFIVFNTTPVFQITSTGPRRGSLQPGSQLLAGERFVQKTIRKRLEEGKNDSFLCPAIDRDNFMLQMLEDLISNGHSVENKACFPATYLCCPESNSLLTARKDADSLRWIEQGIPTKVFNHIEQLIQHRKLFQVNAGTDNEGVGRVGYPYMYVFGRGVVGVSNDLSTRWMATPHKEACITRPDVHMDLRGPT
jgi:hypothetical protein